MSKLSEIATKLLHDHGSTAALKPFVAALRADADLLTALAREYLDMIDKTTARQKTGPHRRPKAKMPTPLQRKASLAMMDKIATNILDTRKLRDGRAIGDVRFLELPRLASFSAMKGADFLRRGFEDVVDAIACKMMAGHAAPATADARVREVMKPKDVETFYAQARQIAANRVAEETARVARNYEELPQIAS